MKKIVFSLSIFTFSFIVLMLGFTLYILEPLRFEDLPDLVYDTSLEPTDRLSTLFLDSLNPLNPERHDVRVLLLNLIMFDLIKENVNPLYDPLSESDNPLVHTVIEHNRMYVRYLIASLDDDDQMILNIGLESQDVSRFTTHITLTLDVDADALRQQLTLTLKRVNVGPLTLSERLLDRFLESLDETQLNDALSVGTLDLSERTYTLTWLDVLP